MTRVIKRLLLPAMACAVLLCMLVPVKTQAAINPFVSFQGKLTNPDGTNVTDGNYSIRFRIYTDPSADTGSCANTCKWEETQGTVAVSGGLFTVNLGSATTLPGSVDFNNSTLYLGIKVSTDAEMTPRVRLTAAPYAFNSDMLDGIDSSGFVQLSGGNINIGAGTVTSGAVNGITVGGTIQPSAAGALTIQANGANALTLTSGAAATWSTTAGLLTMQGAGGVAINTPNVSGASSAITIQGGNSSAGTAGNVTIDTGTTSTGTPTVNIANANAKAVQVGNNTSNPAITIDSGTGTIAIGTGAQARTLNIGTGGAAQTVTVGSTNGASTLDLQAGTGGIDITTQGTGSINIGNNAVAQTINIGNATGATTVAVLCGTGACGFGNNAVAHTTTLGSATGTATTVLQAGSGGLSLTSGGNITLGTSDTTGTLLVLDTKTNTGDPTGVNGGSYYNSADSKFRCFENGVWKNCLGSPTNASTADQVVGASTTAYLTGSMITVPASGLQVGSTFVWKITMSKTAAGTLANTFDVRVGTNGTTADTSRLSFAMGTQTAVADTAVVTITATVRSVSATSTMAGNYQMTHNLAATGFDNALQSKTANVTSGTFDNTTSGLKIGISTTTAASYSLTFQQVQVTTTNL